MSFHTDELQSPEKIYKVHVDRQITIKEMLVKKIIQRKENQNRLKRGLGEVLPISQKSSEMFRFCVSSLVWDNFLNT